MPQCNKCSAHLEPGQKFCSFCGAPQTPAPAPESPPPAADTLQGSYIPAQPQGGYTSPAGNASAPPSAPSASGYPPGVGTPPAGYTPAQSGQGYTPPAGGYIPAQPSTPTSGYTPGQPDLYMSPPRKRSRGGIIAIVAVVLVVGAVLAGMVMSNFFGSPGGTGSPGSAPDTSGQAPYSPGSESAPPSEPSDPPKLYVPVDELTVVGRWAIFDQESFVMYQAEFLEDGSVKCTVVTKNGESNSDMTSSIYTGTYEVWHGEQAVAEMGQSQEILDSDIKLLSELYEEDFGVSQIFLTRQHYTTLRIDGVDSNEETIVYYAFYMEKDGSTSITRIGTVGTIDSWRYTSDDGLFLFTRLPDWQ